MGWQLARRRRRSAGLFVGAGEYLKVTTESISCKPYKMNSPLFTIPISCSFRIPYLLVTGIKPPKLQKLLVKFSVHKSNN